MKKVFALILAVMMLSGCVPHTELDRLAIAEAVGLDFENGIYTVTLQYFNTDSSGGVTAVDSTAPNATVAEGKGKTIESALEALSYKTGRSITIGAATVMVFGESALFSLEDALRLAASHYSGNLRADIAAARGKASDVMNVRFKEGNASVEKLEDMLCNAEELGLTRRIKMYEVSEKLCGETKSVVLPLFQAYSGGSELTEDGSGVIIAGGALFTGGEFARELSVREMSGLAMLDPAPESIRNCEMTLSYMGEDTRVMLYKVKPHITPRFEGGKLAADIEITADCKIVSTSISDPYEHREGIERVCAEEAVSRVSELVSRTFAGNGADISGLGYVINAHSPALWSAVVSDCRSALKAAEYNVTADIRMERYGVVR
ncbi:MAG: hypothetical protein IJU82_05035 [Ruminiclostridium sp.]|nr:hypothetical protein [Ruminiclostridium sp.]